MLYPITKLQAIIRYDQVKSMEEMLNDIEHGYFVADCMHHDAKTTEEQLEAQTHWYETEKLENQFRSLFMGLVVEYYDWFSKRWSAWTEDMFDYQDAIYRDRKNRDADTVNLIPDRKYCNCDRMVLESLKDYLWVSVPQEIYLNNTGSKTFLEDAAKVLASKKESEEGSDI